MKIENFLLVFTCIAAVIIAISCKRFATLFSSCHFTPDKSQNALF